MNKHLDRFFCSFAAVVSIIGCSKEPGDSPAGQTIQDSQEVYTLKAVMAHNQTKTVIHNKTAVYWSPKDSIVIFYKGRSSKFVGTNDSVSDTTTFKGKLGPKGSITIGEDGTFLWGLYPYSSTATCSGSAVTVEVPAAQTAMEGTFAPGLFPSIAKSSSNTLYFCNVCGGVVFSVSQGGIKSVTLKGNDSENIAGSVNVEMDDDGKPLISSYIDGKTEITVTAPGGGSFHPGSRYYIVACPATLSKGYSLKYTKDGTDGTFTSSNAVTIKRSTFGRVENKDKSVIFAPSEDNIPFADAIAKQACVKMFDTNGDGEVSYAEAYAATSLKDLFQGDYSGVTSFEEIKYFVNVTSLETNTFYGCSCLNEITIPSTITAIGSQCFGANMNAVFMTGTVPPSIENDSFDAGTVIYVPASALEDYKSSWAAYKDNIKAIMGEANCFVVPSYTQHVFDAAKKGNSEESVGQIASAEVLWETFGTDTAPSVGDIVSNVSYKNGRVFFTASGKDGNAAIAVKDASGNILWSWHIWVCKDFDPDASAQVYNNDAGTMMDRNIGAISATPGDLGALGLLYQWGRKDPFIGNISVTSESQYGTVAASTITWPHTSTSDESSGTIAYAVANPTTFIVKNDYNNDWYYTGSAGTDNTRWQASGKTMYDPCPYGWKVPVGGDDSIWSKAFGSGADFKSGPWDSTNRGMDFGKGNGKDQSMQLGQDETIWYPATGCRSHLVGGMKYPGSNGYCWTCSPADTSAVSFYFDLTKNVKPSSTHQRAEGQSVRCQKE